MADSRPLEGLRVLDFSTLLPGPLAGLMLAQSGAEVIKIEPPEGDAMRGLPPFHNSQSVIFTFLNQGKKSLCVDLKNDREKQDLMKLVRKADILIEQFRPGVMERLGMGYEQLRELNPGLIYCSITGYGQQGPKAGKAGHDLNYMAETGILALSPGPPERPVLPPVLIADIAGGSYPAMINILLAVMERQRTGKGRHIDISMSQSLFTLGFWGLAKGCATGDWPGRGEDLFTGGSPRYQLYPTKDGALLAVAAVEDKFWAAFCKAIDLEDDQRGVLAEQAGVCETVRKIIGEKDGDHWRRIFEQVDCCCSIVKNLEEALDDPHFELKEQFKRKYKNADGERLPALPLPLIPAYTAAPGSACCAPELGQDNKEYFASEE